MHTQNECDAITVPQRVIRMIDGCLERVAIGSLNVDRVSIPNALLNIAVERMLAQEGTARTATVLQRMAGLVANGVRPQGDDAYSLTQHDA